MRPNQNFSKEVKQRAVRMVFKHESEYKSRWQAVESICAMLPIAPSTFYAHKTRRLDPDKRSMRAKRDEQLQVEIQRVYDESDSLYGVDKVWRQLKIQHIDVARCTVERLMRNMGFTRGSSR